MNDNLILTVLEKNNFKVLESFASFSRISIGPCCIQPAFTCSELALETLEQGVKYFQKQK